jgi:voltage-gated potassium channel
LAGAFGGKRLIWFFLGMARLVRSLRRGLRDPEFRALLALMGLMLVIGTGFYTTVEDWRLIDSLYFSATTLATVGYGDFAPTTDEGKLFTIVYMLTGVGVFVALAGKLAGGLIKGEGTEVASDSSEPPSAAGHPPQAS